MNDISAVRDSWWLASLGNTLIWARLRLRPAGTAEVLDSDGNTLSYDSEDTARSQQGPHGAVAGPARLSRRCSPLRTSRPPTWTGSTG